jgi:hypothetical protein
MAAEMGNRPADGGSSRQIAAYGIFTWRVELAIAPRTRWKLSEYYYDQPSVILHLLPLRWLPQFIIEPFHDK